MLRGPDGAIAWQLGTGWYLKHTRDRLRKETQHEPMDLGTGSWYRCSFEGRGYAVEIHSAHPTEYITAPERCGLNASGECYFDQGFLMGDDAFEALCEGGDEGLWSWMEGVYETYIAAPERAQ